MKDLEEHGWISERGGKKPWKGRPNKVYSLKVSFNEIIAGLEKQQKKAVDEMRSKIERLRKARRY
jgi:predicted transcriptional regulator